MISFCKDTSQIPSEEDTPSSSSPHSKEQRELSKKLKAMSVRKQFDNVRKLSSAHAKQTTLIEKTKSTIKGLEYHEKKFKGMLEELPKMVKQAVDKAVLSKAKEIAKKVAEEQAAIYTKEYFDQKLTLKGKEIVRLRMQLGLEKCKAFDEYDKELAHNKKFRLRQVEKFFDYAFKETDKVPSDTGKIEVNFIGLGKPTAIQVNGREVTDASQDNEDQRKIPCFDPAWSQGEGDNAEEREIPGEIAECG